MDFVLSDDQAALQHELRRLLAAHLDAHGRRPGVDRDLWRQLGAMGVFSLMVPEADGGAGLSLGLADAVVVFEELGRAAVAGPLVDTFLLAGTVPGAETGEVVVGITPSASPALVEHLADLDVLVVDDGSTLSALDAVPEGALVARPTDPLTPVAVVPLLGVGSAIGPSAPVRDVGGLLVAALQVGLGQAALDLGVAHAQEREQFGRPIGSFQAVKHLLADAAVAVETARAAVHAAAVTTDEGTASDRARPGARLVASHAADLAGRTCIQVHGGMGYTWELDAHLLLKRSIVLDTAFGGVDATYDAVAGSLGPSGGIALAGRRVVVVGASAGIGRALAIEAAGAGADVVLAARRQDLLDATIAEAGTGVGVALDVCDPASRAALVALLADGPPVDLVVVTVGVADLRPLADTDDDRWAAMLTTNLVGVARLLDELRPVLAPAGILAVTSSEAGREPRMGLVPYGATKAALETVLTGLRIEHPGLRVSCIVVGSTFPTEFGAHFEAEHLTTAMASWQARGQVPTVFMTPEDVAAVLVDVYATALRHPGVGVEEISLRPASPPA